MSLMLIALVASVAAGGTLAFFSDTEKAQGLFASGTIDIEVNDQNPWSESVAFKDMKPCDWEYQKFTIRNVGTNEGPVYLHLNVTGNGDALNAVGAPIVSEPECVAENGTWTNPNGPCEGRTEISDIQNHITIDLTIDDSVMISPDDHVKLGDLHCHYIPLGWLGTSDPIEVELSFHLQAETGNAYQGDMVSFEIEFYMTDHNAPPPEGSMILLENKDPNTWNVIDDNLWGYAVYYASDLELFVYAEGLTPDTNYQISLTSPEVATWYPITGAATRIGMAEALAAGVYGTGTTAAPPTDYNLFERGYYDISDGGNNLLTGPPSTWEGDDIGVFTTSQSGDTPRTITSDAQGRILEWVSFPLPSGEYQHIKVMVKEDFSPYKVILMEATTPLFFTISP